MQEYLKPIGYLLIATIILCSGCGSESNTTAIAPVAPTIEADITRYEKRLIEVGTQTVAEHIAQLKEDYPAFSDIYFHQILSIPDKDEILPGEVEHMITDTGYQKLLVDVAQEYYEFDTVAAEISQTLENYQEIFDVAETPNVYTFVSGFTYQCFLFDDLDREGIGLGLDMFLGADFPYEKINPSNPAFSAYLTRFYDREHIAKKVAEVLVEDKLPPPSRSDFLSLMIWGGKKLYIMDQLLDFKEDHVVIEYTPEQLRWCRENEVQIWDFFFEKDLFYETDLRKFNKLVGPAPTTPGMPPESPGRTANYIGWQIIRAYVDRHPETTIADLIQLTDAQLILDESRYKPSR